ncbi:MAG: site-specific integrase, partial [Pyrinomonadaceae bacterium]
SASTKVVVLEEFSGYLDNSATSATVRPADCANFYAALQERVSESTAEGYMMTLRSFFRWAVEVKRTRLDNPIAKVEVVRAEHIARKRFADKKTKN